MFGILRMTLLGMPGIWGTQGSSRGGGSECGKGRGGARQRRIASIRVAWAIFGDFARGCRGGTFTVDGDVFGTM